MIADTSSLNVAATRAAGSRGSRHYGELVSWSLDSGTSDVVMHDKDGMLTSSGPLGVGRGTNGLVKNITVGSTTETYSYNVNDEVLGVTTGGVTGGYAVTYVRDTLGRITKKTEVIGGTTVVTSYGYDTAGRLWKVYANGSPTPTSTYTYDANGNRAGGTYDGQDRLTALGATTYTYGPNGELKTKTDASGTTTYTYDAHGNLRRVVPPAPGATIDYVIDGENRRVGKRVAGNLVNGWVYDGPRVVAELDASGAVLSRFYYGAKDHSPESMVRGGVSYRILTDHLGSPRLVVNATTGAIAQRIEYDAWGKVTSDTSPAFQPFGFAGGIYDRSTGLTRFGARDYDANSGRWTSKDRSAFSGGLNFYEYASDDPINFIDSTGHNPAAVGAAGVGAAAAVGAGLALWGAYDCAANGCANIVKAGDAASDFVHKIIDGDKNPQGLTGPPGDTIRGPTKTTTYGPDGFPDIDHELGHPDHAPPNDEPHCHDWGRPGDGRPPTHNDRGPGRPPEPGDPPAPRGPGVPPPQP